MDKLTITTIALVSLFVVSASTLYCYKKYKTTPK